MRASRVITRLVVTITAGLLWAVSARGQATDIGLGPDGLALTYAKASQNHITVQVSTDLAAWIATFTVDDIVSEVNGVQTIRSLVGTGTESRLFYRLLVRPAWTVTLAWDSVPDANVAGYRVYYRTDGDAFTDGDPFEREVDVGNSTRAAVSLPADSRTYHFAVTCYNSVGAESDRSEEVRVSRSPLPL